MTHSSICLPDFPVVSQVRRSRRGIENSARVANADTHRYTPQVYSVGIKEVEETGGRRVQISQAD